MRKFIKRNASLFALILILLLAVCLCFYKLGSQSLNEDEGVSLYFAAASRASIADMIDTMIKSGEMHPPGYFIFLRCAVKFFGDGEYSLRILSALFGILNVLLVYLFTRIWSRREPDEENPRYGTALIGAALLATSSFAVTAAQEARMYSMAVFFNLLALIFLSLWIKSKRSIYLLAYAPALTCAFYTHYYSVLIWFFTGVFLFFEQYIKKNKSYGKSTSQWCVSSAASFALFSPWLLKTFLTSFARAGGIYNFPVGAPELLSGLVQLFTGPSVIIPGGYLMFIIGSLAVIILILRGAKYFNGAGPLLIILLFGIIFSTFFVSFFGKFKIYQPKYLILVLPFFCVLTARALTSSKSKMFFILVLLGWLGVNYISWHNWTYNPYYGNPDYRLACAYLTNAVKPDNEIILIGSMKQPVFYYYYRGAGEICAVEKPEEIIFKKQTADKGRIWVIYVPCLFPEMPRILTPNFKLLDTKSTQNYFKGNLLRLQFFEKI